MKLISEDGTVEIELTPDDQNKVVLPQGRWVIVEQEDGLESIKKENLRITGLPPKGQIAPRKGVTK